MKSHVQLKKFAKEVLLADESISNSQLYNICRSQFSDVEQLKFIKTLHRAIWYCKEHYNYQRDYRF